MTTIACDGQSIAGDSRITGNGTIHDDSCPKVFLLKDGRVVGISGPAYCHEQALEFLNGDREEVDFGDEFEALMLSPDGECRCMDGKGRTYRHFRSLRVRQWWGVRAGGDVIVLYAAEIFASEQVANAA